MKKLWLIPAAVVFTLLASCGDDNNAERDFLDAARLVAIPTGMGGIPDDESYLNIGRVVCDERANGMSDDGFQKLFEDNARKQVAVILDPSLEFEWKMFYARLTDIAFARLCPEEH